MINDYYLVLEKVIDLPSPKRNLIMDLYRDMLHRVGDPGSESLVSSYFNTLEMAGLIANRTTVEREKKLNHIVNE
jgi:hypothetical protein